MKKKILILTAIEPNKYNKNGPSGLIWECKNLLEKVNVDFDIQILNDKNKLNKLGLFLKKIYVDNIYDVILVYPFHLYFKLDRASRKKAIVLGPDSPSLLFKRFFNSSLGSLEKIKNLILKYWFLYQEKNMLKNVNKLLVVGKNDSRWLKYNFRLYSDKIFYLTHPILTSVLESKNEECNSEKYNKLMLIFSGDMSKKYTGKLIEEFYQYIGYLNIDIFIVGKNNKWIFELFKHKKKNVKYIEWIEQFNCICNHRYHIHVIPLMAGAGTKNRTLTACAMGVPIFSTFIGLENVYYGKPCNYIFKFKNVKELIVKLKNIENIINNPPQEGCIIEYINRVNMRYKIEFLSYLGLKNDNS